jgi:alkylation response protein AidB-like acyl-CoA dehydrogenase
MADGRSRALSESAIVRRAREVAELVRASRAEIDASGRMPDAVVEAMHEAGLFRMAVPASVGGEEVHPLEYSRVVEEIARADGSAAWCVMQGSASGTIAAYLEPDAAREVFGEPRTVFAAGTPTPALGRADAVAGGYRVNGRWAFASGCRHCNWVVARCAVYDGDQRREDLGPWVNLLVPMADARIEESWDVRGLRATGSDTYVVEDAFVPDRFMASFARKPREPGRLYRVGDLQLAHLSMASAALAMARDCLDEFAALASHKRVNWTAASIGASGVAQVEIARATATADAALALRDQTAHAMWEAAGETGRATPEQRARFRLAILHGVDVGVEVVDTVYRLSGTTGIFAGHPIQRHFQDVNVLSQQIVGRWSYYETIGKALLGQEFDPGWL